MKNGYSIFYTQFDNDLAFTNAAIFHQFKKIGTFGFGFMQTKVTSLYKTKEVDGEFVTDGNFSYINRMLKVNYSPKLMIKTKKMRIQTGVTLTSYYTEISTVSGKGNNIDIGTYIHHPFGEASIIAKNILSNSIDYSNDGRESLQKRTIISNILIMKTPLTIIMLSVFSHCKIAKLLICN